EADRDVAIVNRQAEAMETIAEAEAEDDEDDVEWLRNELDGLRERLATVEGALAEREVVQVALASQVTELTAALAALALQTPPPPSEVETRAETLEQAETLAENDGEAGPRENPAPDKPAPRLRRRVWL